MIDSLQSLNALQCSLPHPPPDRVSFPTLEEVKELQTRHKASRPFNVRHDDSAVFRYLKQDGYDGAGIGPIWVPNGEEEFKLRLMVIAHAREGVHASQTGTLALLAHQFRWAGMRQDVRYFVRSCLHCIRGDRGRQIPRPLGETMMATEPGEILHVDFLSIGESDGPFTKILVMKDNWSGFCRLIPTIGESAAIAAEQISSWCKDYTIPRW
eukprot:GHVU01145779.1.p1 GENE.GHVU01145779.1~~GHVU01145779.1.p1  ORF type:complete len:211 (+),score=16.84 GHVU01145779.1:426-1058(+)